VVVNEGLFGVIVEGAETGFLDGSNVLAGEATIGIFVFFDLGATVLGAVTIGVSLPVGAEVGDGAGRTDDKDDGDMKIGTTPFDVDVGLIVIVGINVAVGCKD
jgi:hypothetical protein